MNALYTRSRVIHKYESKPRYYDTDESLYMIEMHILASVFRNEGITVTELAQQIQRTKNAGSQQINKLQKTKIGIIPHKFRPYSSPINDLNNLEADVTSASNCIQIPQH